ncbi:hypothetical protein [Clostridium thermobutyricum]|uniref:hypothetical protein n=1 Tax=Clostridium thermobutyricum TaxID=29372 RepID=UPI00294273C2|nr:hypothetical protein [Clostridium thermobutyricum]
MAEGWIKQYRAIREHWLWSDKPFARGQAFDDLLLMVNHQDNKVLIDGELILVKKGQRITSLRALGESWGWSVKKVKKFLELLQNDNMISFECDTKKTLITIQNWSKYQEKETVLDVENREIAENEETQKKHGGNTEETQKKHTGNTEETQKKHGGKQTRMIKKEKNDNNEKNEEEGEEKTSHSTLDGQDRNSIENKIFDIVGEIPFESWFKKCDIYETDKNIVIKADNELIERTIKKYYLEKLNALLNKNILLEKREEDKMG